MGDGSGCGVNYFCLGAVFIFVGSVLLCALGFTVVLPHQATKSWPEVVCNVTNATYHPTMCSCNHQSLGEKMCLRRYPCLQVTAVYAVARQRFLLQSSITTTDSNSQQSEAVTAQTGSDMNFNMTGTLTLSNLDLDFDLDLTQNTTTLASPVSVGDVLFQARVTPQAEVTSEGKENYEHFGGRETRCYISAALYNTWSDAFYEKCALNECGAEEWNIKETERFHKENALPGLTQPCYIDPKNEAIVILSRTPHSHMVHAVVWPVVSLVVGITLWVGLCLGCWRMEKEFEPIAPKSRQYGLL